MFRSFSIVDVLVLSCALAIARPSYSQEAPRTERTPSVERLREHWKEHPRAERELLERRLETLAELPQERREELLARARRLRGYERELAEAAPEALRRRLAELGPEQGRRTWEDHVRQRARERAEEVRRKLPAELIERLERVPRAQRALIVERMLREREAVSLRALRRLGRINGLDGRAIQELQERPLDERMKALLRLKRELIEREIERQGLPGLERREWDELRRSPDEEFHRRLRRYRLPPIESTSRG
jgi:hypothetical protein